MPHIPIDFEKTPDQVLPIPTGIYTLRVTEVPMIEAIRGEGKGDKVVIRFAVDQPQTPELHDRAIFDHIALSGAFGPTRLKRLMKAAGVPISASGINTEELLDKRVQAKVKQRQYKDDAGEIKETSSIEDYIFS